MAYNPFNIFRRNQKVIFAVLTVFIMFMFTLSSGVVGGDFFETFTQWLGSKGKRGDAAATIDGDKVYQRDLDQLRFNRLMANRYMLSLAGMTMQQLDQVVDDQLTRMSTEGQNIMRRVMDAERALPEARNMSRNPQTAQILEQIGRSPAQLEQQIRAGLNSIVQAPTIRAEDKEVARTKLAKLVLQDYLMQGAGEHYFFAAPNRTQREQLEFMLWQKKADQLGIRFTTDDVGRLVRRELFDKLTDQVQASVQKRLTTDMHGFTMANCLKALGEEFRVRAAQVAVLGPQFHGNRGDKTYGATPIFNPPYEAFEFFRDRCSPSTYAALPVPAANLLAEVDRRMALPPGHSERIAPPTDDDLKALFDKYQNATPDPARETPGFKIPTRVRVDWFQLTGEEPYYKAEAEKSLKNDLLRANLMAVMNTQAFGTPAGQLAANSQWFLTDPLLTAAYDKIVAKHRETLIDRYSSADVNFRGGLFGMPILDSSVVRPANLAVAAGGMGGQLAGFGNTLAGLSMTVTGPMAFERIDRVRTGLPAVLGMTPGPAMFNTALGGTVAYQLMLPRPLPVEVYRPDLLKNLTAERAKELAFGNNKGIVGDVNTFTEEVNKLSEEGKARDKAAAQKYIDEFLAKRGIVKRGNKTPLSEWDLERDPELAPLVAAHRDSLRDPENPHQNNYMPFGRRFFYEVTETGARPALGTYKASEYLRGSRSDFGERTKYVVWRAEEIPAAGTTPITAKETVKAAWKRNKARELAKAMAEDIAKKIRESGKTAEDDLLPFIRDRAAELGPAFPPLFSIRGVCPLTTLSDNPTGRTIPSYGLAPTPETGTVHDFGLIPSENLKYPSQEFLNAIMDDRTKPSGTTLVLTDSPKDTFFVTTLVKREEKNDTDYKIQVASGGLSATRGGPVILGTFRYETGQNTRRSAIGFLKLQFKYDESDEQKKKLDENEKRGGDS